MVGCSRDIIAERKEGFWEIVFYQGRGDCQAGCIEKMYTYFTVDDSGNVDKVKTEGKLWETLDSFWVSGKAFQLIGQGTYDPDAEIEKKPFANTELKITLKQDHQNQISSTQTDSEGNFSFGIANGEYCLIAFDQCAEFTVNNNAIENFEPIFLIPIP